jgi:hypothetical protein
MKPAVVYAFLAVLGVTMTTSPVSIYGTPTTEEYGYTYPDGSSEEEKQEIDEKEQEAWEDAGRPGENNANSNDGDDDEELPTCNDSDLRYQQRDCKTAGPYGRTCEMPSSDDACQSDKPANIQCSDGSFAETQEMCPSKQPYCDQLDSGPCFDRQDYDENTG